MQLDNTRLAIRERGLLESLDLALHLLREFAGPIFWCLVLGIVPLALLNYALVGWMADIDFDEDAVPLRFLWNMALLIYLEAPLAGAFAVSFLGPAVFMQTPTIRQVLADTLRCTLQLAWCQLILRGILAAWVLLLLVDRFEPGWIEYFFLPVIAVYATVVRAVRPYINEIILLEKNPLRARRPTDITIGRRSQHLHGPSAADLFVRWLGSALVAMLLVLLVGLMLYAAVGVLISDWRPDWFKLQFGYPLALWLVAGYFTVVRFLNYLDLRIRHEGWEVELLMRAEALQLTSKLSV